MMSVPISRLAKALILSAALSAAQPAASCGFHLVKPEKTAVDWMVGAPHLVLARPDPENIMRYRIETVLRGGNGLDPIPFLVDAGKRRKMALHPGDAVLFAATESGQWVQVAYADAAFRELSGKILLNADAWSSAYPDDRFRMFAALLDHPSPAISALALSEVDKAPYDMLRTIDLRLSEMDILDQLWSLDSYVFQPIRVLLLGVGGGDIAREEVYAYVDRVQHWDRAENLGAYSTALIELEQAAGIAALEERFFADPVQKLEKLDLVIAAMAEHSSAGEPALRPHITQALTRLADNRPDAIPLIAQQFSARGDWSQTDVMKNALKNRKLATTRDLMPVAAYLSQARMADAASPVPSEG